MKAYKFYFIEGGFMTLYASSMMEAITELGENKVNNILSVELIEDDDFSPTLEEKDWLDRNPLVAFLIVLFVLGTLLHLYFEHSTAINKWLYE